MNYVNTKMGQIDLLEPTDSLLKVIQSILPFGFLPIRNPLMGTNLDSLSNAILKKWIA